MNAPKLALIAALTTDRVIGRDGGMPWHIPADLKYFSKVTQGRPVIMGRRTWESLGKALPNRRNIVVTSNPDASFLGAETALSLEDALRKCPGDSLIFCIGGAVLYQAALPYADYLYLTEIHSCIEGDTLFPERRSQEWAEQSREAQSQDTEPSRFDFVVYARRS
jgi:dihydrofolate reductase